MVVIQFITVQWSKKSRGAPEAVKRNSVAEAFPLPKGSIKNGQGIFLHELWVDELHGFQVPNGRITNQINDTKLRDINLEIQSVGDGLAIYYWGNLKRPSYPKRKQVFRLAVGMSGRILSNGRFSGESTWYYQKHVYNIYYGQDNLFSGFFTETQPDLIYKDEVNLY